MPSFTFVSESMRFARNDVRRVFFDFRRRIRDRTDNDYREGVDYADYETECYFASLDDLVMNNNGRHTVNLPMSYPNAYLEYEVLDPRPGENLHIRVHYGTNTDNFMELKYARVVESHLTANENLIGYWMNVIHLNELLGDRVHPQNEVVNQNNRYNQNLYPNQILNQNQNQNHNQVLNQNQENMDTTD